MGTTTMRAPVSMAAILAVSMALPPPAPDDDIDIRIADKGDGASNFGCAAFAAECHDLQSGHAFESGIEVAQDSAVRQHEKALCRGREMRTDPRDLSAALNIFSWSAKKLSTLSSPLILVITLLSATINGIARQSPIVPKNAH